MERISRRLRRRVRAWWWGAAAVATTLALAPATASAWACRVAIEKTVAQDYDCDGDADTSFSDAALLELDGCAVYRVCVTNTGTLDLDGQGVTVSDAALGVVNLDFGSIGAGAAPVCKLVPVDAPASACVADPGACTCAEVEGTNTAEITNATCGEGLVACDAPESVCADSATVECRRGCLTRTPGFWGNHPDIVLYGLATIGLCGQDDVGGSALIQDLCSLGTDKALYPSVQSAQLVRQCTAAALNDVASVLLGGRCVAGLEEARFEECCGSAQACASVPEGCIEDLDRFNGSQDTLLDGAGAELSLCHELGFPCAAQPAQCTAARDDGVIGVSLP